MRPGRAIVLGGKKFVTECSLILFLCSVSCSGSSSSFPGSCFSSPSRWNLKIKQKFDQCGIQVIRRGFQFNGRWSRRKVEYHPCTSSRPATKLGERHIRNATTWSSLCRLLRTPKHQSKQSSSVRSFSFCVRCSEKVTEL